MCGRYYIDQEDDLAEMRKILTELNKRFYGQPALSAMKTGEIFPSNVVPVLQKQDKWQQTAVQPDKSTDQDHILPGLMRWGFDRPGGSGLLINARAETAAAKPFFRKAFKYGRILIPASAFFEWRKVPVDADSGPSLRDQTQTKSDHVRSSVPQQLTLDALLDSRQNQDVSSVNTPTTDDRKSLSHSENGTFDEQVSSVAERSDTIKKSTAGKNANKVEKKKMKLWLSDEPTFYMAGLCQPADDITGYRFVILTTEAQPGIRHIHDRQPLILPRAWLRSWILNESEAVDQLAYVTEKPLQFAEL